MKTIRFAYILAFFAAGIVLPAGCRNREAGRDQPEIAVTNSYLQCAVEDLCGQDIRTLCLAPPGMCPGHFDMSPSQVSELCKCKILLLFDFQESIEGSLSRMKDNGLKVGLVKTQPGLCVPETYVAICREVADILSSAYPQRKEQYEQRLSSIQKRMEKMQAQLRAAVTQSGATSANVIASNHQAHFARWLGLETIATFAGSDMETMSNISDCLSKAEGRDVRFVIANKQEGTALAESMADRLHAKAVVFSNFPALDADGTAFDQLLAQNVQALVKAVQE